jgi:ATP-dependent Clp protease ATP-binding subunit ClpA
VQLYEKHVKIALTDGARSWLAVRGYDERMGARPLGRVIQDHIKRPLAEEILFGQLEDGGLATFNVSEDGEGLTFVVTRDGEAPADEEAAHDAEA